MTKRFSAELKTISHKSNPKYTLDLKVFQHGMTIEIGAVEISTEDATRLKKALDKIEEWVKESNND